LRASLRRPTGQSRLTQAALAARLAGAASA
jgi:hypothetical protein